MRLTEAMAKTMKRLIARRRHRLEIGVGRVGLDPIEHDLDFGLPIGEAKEDDVADRIGLAAWRPCAVPVARANRQGAYGRVSGSLEVAPHRLRPPSCPADRPRDLYGSI